MIALARPSVNVTRTTCAPRPAVLGMYNQKVN
jgi:hypothetical protein